jgi:hypothetical protein
VPVGRRRGNIHFPAVLYTGILMLTGIRMYRSADTVNYLPATSKVYFAIHLVLRDRRIFLLSIYSDLVFLYFKLETKDAIAKQVMLLGTVLV